MVPSRVLAAPGLRTAAHPRWSTEVGTALAVIAGQPVLWLLGAAGFTLRGGIVLLTLPILVLPTQVEVRLALGGNLGSTGLTAGFWGLVALGSLVTAFIAVLVLLVLARLEMASFQRLAVDPESGDMRAWQAPRTLVGGRQRLLFSRVFTIQALALLGLVLFALPLASSVGPATLEELLRPTSSGTIYVRVLDHLVPQLILFGVGVVIVEMVSAVATRTLLLQSAGLGSTGRPSRRPLLGAVLTGVSAPLRSPIRTVRTSALGWLATLVALLPVLWAIGVAWQATRATFLATTSVSDMARDPGTFIVAFALAAVFAAGLLVTGFASAFRAGLWTIDALGKSDSADASGE